MYVVNKSIRIEYQPAGGTAGLTVGAEIWDETGNKDTINFPDFLLSEMVVVGSSMYRGEFVPDTVGTWTVHIADSVGGTAVKQYVVGKDIENMLIMPPMIA